MIRKFFRIVTSVFDAVKMASRQLKHQFPYELKNASACKKTGKHLLEIKIAGKSQSISYVAEEIAADDGFIAGFSPTDIRVISYLAACDKYEAILEEERIKKSYEIIRSRSIKGDKTIQLRHKTTGECVVVALKDFADRNLIDKLDAQDVYQIGYLAGQEQSWRDNLRLKIVSIKNEDRLDDV